MIKRSLNIQLASNRLPVRDPFGHKGSFGKALLICGSKNMVGCCVLATTGALRSGIGLVTLAFPDVIYNALASRLTENLFLPLPSDSDGIIAASATDKVLEEAKKADVIMAGCGIGIGDGAKQLVKRLLTLENKPIILDADAINCLCDMKEDLKKTKADVLLTPHPGEMARLIGKTVAEVEESREECVCTFCKEYGVNLLLKGRKTLICNKDVTELYVNKTGNTGLSKGG